jgi:predicted O-linked N-acetylglucosamine transferase (SPINDLY family)
VLLNMSACFTGQGKIAEAYDCLQRVISAEPQNLKAYSGLLLTQYYDMSIQLNEIFAAARRFADRFEDPLRGEWPETGSTWHAGRPIRVGVVSADLRNHSVGFFLEGVLRKLDRKSLVLVAYVSQEADDALSERIKPFFEEWLNVRNLSDAQLADRISGDNIDLLLDLSGHTLDNRLLTFARKPAPVQVTWLGYPGTTGLESMDFIIADAVTIPPNEERFYTEKVWRLPETYICFTPPDLNLPVANLPSLERPCFTFGCFNNPAKINDSVVACWAEILNAVPGSELLLKNRNFEHEAERELFRQRFILHGIDSARLCFEGYLDQEDHYAAYHRIDMALDPFPYNGVTTTCEALWMGVPSLTLRMERGMFGHNGEMIMKSVGLEDWVAGSIDDYRGRAVAFASNPAWLASLRITLRQALLSSPLCATERFARNLEDAFRGMVLKSECTSIQGRS